MTEVDSRPGRHSGVWRSQDSITISFYFSCFALSCSASGLWKCGMGTCESLELSLLLLSGCVFTVCAANTLTAPPSPPSSTCRPGCRWNGRGCWGPPSSFSWSPPRCTRDCPGCRTTSITGATCCAGSCRGPWWPSWWWVARFFTPGGWDGGGGVVVCWLEPWIQKMIYQ